MQLYQLSSISVSSDAVYFSAVGPRPNNPAIPPYDPSADSQSDIFKLPFDPLQGRIQDPTQTLQPLFLAAGIARSPFVAPDGSVIAYLRTRTDIGNYQYDLVVRNEADRTERRITSAGLGFSRPVVVDRSAYANLIHPDQYWIQVAPPGQQDMKRLVAITDASIDSAHDIELSIK
jgi:Tol biopolymer transport system component